MADLRYTVDVDTRGAQQNLRGLTGSIGNLKGALAGAFAATGVVAFGKQILAVSGEYETMRNQLKLVTSGHDDLAATMSSLQDVSNRTFTTLQDTVRLYSNLKLSTEALGKSSEAVTEVTEKFQKALALSGADLNTASGAIRQFGQAMASGTVRGDEFNSIVEALGPALAIMARDSGTTVGELRQLSQAGELTAEVFFEMIKGAEALDKTFASLDITTEQIGKNLQGTFKETLNILDEATGASGIYRGVMQLLNRDIADFFGTSQSLAGLTPEELFGAVEEGALNASKAIFELQARQTDAMGFFDAYGLGSIGYRAELQKQIDAIKELTEKRKEELEAAQKQLEADAEATRIRNEMMAPLTAMSTQLKEITKAYEKNIPQNEKLKTEYESVTETLNKLLALRDQEVAQTPEYAKALETTRARLEQLKLELNDTTKSSKEAAREMARLTDSTTDLVESLSGATKDMAFELEALNMTPLQKQIAEIERDIRTKVAKQIQKLEAAMTPENAAEITEQINRLKDASAVAIENQTRLARESYEHQRTFSFGWNKAFRQYAEDATNAATAAESIFKTTTQGIEDAIVEFAKTGKFSLKSLGEDLSEQLLRGGIQQIFAGLGGGGAGGGGGSNIFSGLLGGLFGQQQQQQQSGGFFSNLLGGAKKLFGGFFANGGYLPAGQFGIVGERGPEMIMGPASIRPSAGSRALNVTINAVDALSFQALVARDPEFIYSVAQRGSRSFV